ncbi:MAG: dCTP deaminase [Planctomycetes bacterium]|nr:dCTP deaminase [Planctomycetota bacterium]
MILSNVEIQRALDERRLVIDPEPSPRKPTAGEPECPYQTSAVDLRLSREISIYKGDTSPVVIDLTKGSFRHLAAVMEPRQLTQDQPLTLAPKRFILGRTHETVELPLSENADSSLAARVEGRSSYARCGLLVHFTAPTIHAGFKGVITLEIMNLGPYSIVLRPEMPICQLIIEEVRGVPFRNDSQFQGQQRPAGT